nr:MAG TPA: hypothetical protein [Caudoviricetes sp.]
MWYYINIVRHHTKYSVLNNLYYYTPKCGVYY